MSFRALAAAQTTAVPGDVAANVEQHLALATAAADAGAKVIVFPELSVTGYELELASKLAFTSAADERLAPLAAFSEDRDVTLVVGAPLRGPDGLFLAALWLSPGAAAGVYAKQHLSGEEVDVFTPGGATPLFSIGGGFAAVAVCADTGHETHPLTAAGAGATTYLVGSLISEARLQSEWGALSRTAARHSMAVVFANYGAPSGGLGAQGGSAIWSNDGRRLASVDGPGPGVVVALEDSSGWVSEVIRES